MEASKSSAGFLLLLGVLVGLVSSSDAYVFYVGGRDGWVLKPSEDYGRWSGRNRFQVNDTLVFKYKSGEDSVLEVVEDDYNSCKLDHPIQRMDGGDSMFKFNRSGPFYFISGTGDRCQKGQKVTIVVLAVRNGKPPSSPAPTPSPQPPTSSPAPPPSAHVPSPAQSPSTHVPSPSPASSSTPPAPSPASSPSSSPPTASSPSPASPASSPPTDQGTAPGPSPTANQTASSSVSSGSGVAFAAMALALGVAFLN